jgi:hypothetical protein
MKRKHLYLITNTPITRIANCREQSSLRFIRIVTWINTAYSFLLLAVPQFTSTMLTDVGVAFKVISVKQGMEEKQTFQI